MQILTTSGYQSPVALANGAGVVAFRRSGRAIVNQIENIDFVDYAEWRRWWQHYDRMPAFNWVRVNGEHVLFCEQSIWRNGQNVCHARDLEVGDELYDDEDDAFLVESMEVFEDRERVWYRFDISGDHSYIIDGLTVHNASRFWVGGTGTWDSSTTTHWAASSNGAGGQSVPGSADTVTLDGSSGGGTVTVNFGGTVTIQSLTMGAFTGTFDNSINNNSFTLSAALAFNASGSGTRSIKLGNGTWTVTTSTTGTVWTIATTTNLTFNANSSTIVFSGNNTAGAIRTISAGGQTYNNMTFSGTGGYNINSATMNVLTIGAGVHFYPSGGATITASSIAVNGSSSQPSAMLSNTAGSAVTISVASGSYSFTWAAIRDMSFAGGATFTASNSFDLSDNSGITITPPAAAGGGQRFSATVF